MRSGTGFRYELVGQDNIDADQFTKEMWKQWEQEAEATSPLKQNLEDEVRKERDSLME